MKRQLVNLRLPPELVARADAEAKRLGQTRTMFVERALESALAEPGMSPELKAKLREHWDSPELERQLLSTDPVRKPKPAPKLPAGVKTARDVALERQAALNKAKGS